MSFAWLIRRAKSLVRTTRRAVARPCRGTRARQRCFGIGATVATGHLAIGPGYGTIAWALNPNRAVWLVVVMLVLRGLATGATVAGGGVGGLFIPLVVMGALLGRLASIAVGDSQTTLFVVVGVAAFLAAGYRVPLAAVMFVAETTGRPGFVIPGLLAAVAAELVMGSASVTAYQRASRFLALGSTRPGDAEDVDPPEP